MSGTRRKPGRLGPFVDGYRARLLELGYTPGTVRGMLKVLGQLGRWMDSEGIKPGALDMAAVEAFRAARGAGGDRRVASVGELRQLLRYLRAVGAMVAAEGRRELTPLEGLLGAYRQWLVVERGLAPATVHRYEMLARRFLGGRVGPDAAFGLAGLTGGTCRRFCCGSALVSRSGRRRAASAS
ncbi:MAG: hypothetical protein ABR569_12595 [Gaiellaceae bacterium]